MLQHYESFPICKQKSEDSHHQGHILPPVWNLTTVSTLELNEKENKNSSLKHLAGKHARKLYY